MKRVLLLATRSLFGQGVENLLSQEKGMVFLGCESDLNTIIEHIKDIKPDVIIVENGFLKSDSGHPLRNLLRSRKQLRIIELGLADESICIYSSQRRLIKEVQDLVEVINQTEEED